MCLDHHSARTAEKGSRRVPIRLVMWYVPAIAKLAPVIDHPGLRRNCGAFVNKQCICTASMVYTSNKLFSCTTKQLTLFLIRESINSWHFSSRSARSSQSTTHVILMLRIVTLTSSAWMVSVQRLYAFTSVDLKSKITFGEIFSACP